MSRIDDERSFHDNWARHINLSDINIMRTFEGSTSPENRFFLKHLGPLQGKNILDIGCGTGESSVYFALKGANCTALDCSSEMLSNVSKLAQVHHVPINTICADTVNTNLSGKSFDIVYAANLLHHTEPIKALDEICRLVKNDGVVCLWDPLIHNPLIKIYRILASKVRTSGEKPLNISFVNEVKKRFNEVTFDTFWLTSQLIFLQFYFLEHVNPNKERYWKKIIYEEERLRNRYFLLENIDSFMKILLPCIRRYAWNIAIVAGKPRQIIT